MRTERIVFYHDSFISSFSKVKNWVFQHHTNLISTLRIFLILSFSFFVLVLLLFFLMAATQHLLTFVNITLSYAYQNDIYCWRALPIVFRGDYGNLDIANKICTSNVSIKIHSLKLMPIKAVFNGKIFTFITGTWCWIIWVSSLNGTKSQCARSSTCCRWV